MNNQDWYDLTEGPSLLQGDLLRDCPVFAVSDSLSWPPGAAADIEVEAKVFDLVVMTQSCDLENEKVEDVLLAQLVAWNDAVRAEVERGNDVVRSRKFRKLLVDGNVPGLSLLHRRDAHPSLPWSVATEAEISSRFQWELAACRGRRRFTSRGPRLRCGAVWRASPRCSPAWDGVQDQSESTKKSFATTLLASVERCSRRSTQ